MKQPTRYFCDICGKEIDEEQTEKLYDVIQCVENEEGKPCAPYIKKITLDLCFDCTLKAVNIKCDYRGTNPRFINK